MGKFDTPTSKTEREEGMLPPARLLVPRFSYATLVPSPLEGSKEKPVTITEEKKSKDSPSHGGAIKPSSVPSFQGNVTPATDELAELQRKVAEAQSALEKRKKSMEDEAIAAATQKSDADAAAKAAEVKKSSDDAVAADKARRAESTPPTEGKKDGSPSKARGRKRLLDRHVDVEAARVIHAQLMADHPPKSTDSLTVEYEAFLRGAGHDVPNALPLFLCGGRAKGMMWSSVLTNWGILRKLYPATTKEERADRLAFDYSLSAKRVLETGSQPFDLELQILRAYAEGCVGIEKRAFSWLLLLTGARPACIYFVPLNTWRFMEAHLRVEWRLRKATNKRDARHGASYLFKWSSSPPDAVVAYLLNSKEESWKFMCPNPTGIAAAVNSWLKKAHDVLTEDDSLELPEKAPTSSAFRDRMDAVLRTEGVDESTMKALMDHSLKMSDAHYCAPE